MNICFCCGGFRFFSTKPRDWLGRTFQTDLFCVEWNVNLFSVLIMLAHHTFIIEADLAGCPWIFFSSCSRPMCLLLMEQDTLTSMLYNVGGVFVL